MYEPNGTIASAYDYAPFGAVTASGIDQPIQWSSEFYDTELALVYYNFRRHYNPMDGRWISRDPLCVLAGFNIYLFATNSVLGKKDFLGLTLPGA